MNTPEITANTNNEVASVANPFGNGRYSGLMKQCNEVAVDVLKMKPEVAEKLALAIGREIGALMSRSSVSIGDISIKTIRSKKDDGKINIKEAAASVKGVTMTNTLLAFQAIAFTQEAYKNGFHITDTAWKMNKTLQDYVDSLA